MRTPLVATLLEVPNGELLPHLRTNPRGFFKSGRKHIAKRRRDDVERLRAISAAPGGPYR